MHRTTPLMSAFVGYVGGGARSLIDKIDDSKLLQEMGGNFMKGETRKGVESPQNYGFTSVVMDAEKNGLGQIIGSAEGFISFMGSNRSHPVCGVMDDRRHRLKGLEKGDVAVFRTKDDRQQFHMTGDGGFWSAPGDKTARMQLVKQKQQQQSGGSAATMDAAAGSAGGGAGDSQKPTGQKPTGQTAVYKGGRKSDFFFHLTQDGAMASGKNVYLRQGTSFGDDPSDSGASPTVEQYDQTDNVKLHAADDGNVYLGGKKGDSGMLRVMLEGEEISQNVFAKSGGGSQPDIRRGMPALVPVLALLLGLSIGLNYALVTDAWRSIATSVIASR